LNKFLTILLNTSKLFLNPLFLFFKRKTKAIHLGIAYPSYVPQESLVKLNPEKLVENVLTLAEADFQDEIQRIDKTLNVKVWDDPVFAVNAYYYNEGNRLILPAGILRWPFFHPDASDGWNYGGLGATIGHEISHAFDNDGKEYDDHGNKNPWWSKEEIAAYQKKTKALIELYSKTKYFGHSLNGYLTLSENIADLGGVDIALAALKSVLKQRKAGPETIKKELRDFFMSYAVSWRTKEKKAKAMQSLFMDVHAPPPARVNNIVCQFDEWYEAFDITPGEVLYKDPQHRIRIF
jgi:putative endopeptidase